MQVFEQHRLDPLQNRAAVFLAQFLSCCCFKIARPGLDGIQLADGGDELCGGLFQGPGRLRNHRLGLDETAASFAKAARSHWGIENRLHWVLDVTFREDDCRVRKDHAPHNFAALRKFALTLLRQDTQYPKRSLRSRRKTAERLPDYRASLLGLIPRG